jgi:Delta7-sterol 5-desaturase
MFPSFRSYKSFVYINSILLTLGFLEYSICVSLYSYWKIQKIIYFLGLLSIFSIRNYGLIQLIDYGTSNKKSISNITTINEQYPYELYMIMIRSNCIETITHMYIVSFMTFYEDLSQYDLVLFIPISFLFEIVFDFFHYSGHRMLHHPSVYRYFHKVHHRFLHPASITTYYQDPVDLLITNSLPTILALYMIPRISHLMFHWLLIYKNFIEISGHCGKISYPASSFPQFVWLPRVLGIELYTENHDIHHSLNNCNYAKRFSLWDKVFGTYQPFQYEKNE